MMLLAGLICWPPARISAAFRWPAADRAKEVALRLALVSRREPILRQLLTEAVLVSIAGGIIGLVGGVVILHLPQRMASIPDVPINVPVNPDMRTYAVAILLALVSGLLFGIVPVGQVMRADPWQIIRTGMSGSLGNRSGSPSATYSSCSDRNLRGAGDFFPRCRAWTGAFAAQQFRIPAAERDSRPRRSAHGRIHQRTPFRRCSSA